MAHVTLIGNLRQFTGGVTELDVEAANVRQLFARLGEKYPDLLPASGDGLRSRHRRPDLPGRPVAGDRPRQRRPHPPADRGGLSPPATSAVPEDYSAISAVIIRQRAAEANLC